MQRRAWRAPFKHSQRLAFFFGGLLWALFAENSSTFWKGAHLITVFDRPITIEEGAGQKIYNMAEERLILAVSDNRVILPRLMWCTHTFSWHQDHQDPPQEQWQVFIESTDHVITLARVL